MYVRMSRSSNPRLVALLFRLLDRPIHFLACLSKTFEANERCGTPGDGRANASQKGVQPAIFGFTALGDHLSRISICFFLSDSLDFLTWFW